MVPCGKERKPVNEPNENVVQSKPIVDLKQILRSMPAWDVWWTSHDGLHGPLTKVDRGQAITLVEIWFEEIGSSLVGQPGRKTPRCDPQGSPQWLV